MTESRCHPPTPDSPLIRAARAEVGSPGVLPADATGLPDEEPGTVPNAASDDVHHDEGNRRPGGGDQSLTQADSAQLASPQSLPCHDASPNGPCAPHEEGREEQAEKPAMQRVRSPSASGRRRRGGQGNDREGERDR